MARGARGALCRVTVDIHPAAHRAVGIHRRGVAARAR
jgi:hypothetical protein